MPRRAQRARPACSGWAIRPKSVAQQSVAQPMAASRRVPQWMFLGHLFNNIIFERQRGDVGQRVEREGQCAAARVC